MTVLCAKVFVVRSLYSKLEQSKKIINSNSDRYSRDNEVMGVQVEHTVDDYLDNSRSAD